MQDHAWARARINCVEDEGAEQWIWSAVRWPRETNSPVSSATRPRHPNQMACFAESRWAIEETFQTSAGEAGMDDYQVRQYTGHFRPNTFSMLA
ncbi:hypothetical protein DM791_15410 [Paenarthrobacter nitroguajacolicus]|nr:hypothetical protein [Paenarthrobacter nitroguajacolicus]